MVDTFAQHKAFQRKQQQLRMLGSNLQPAIIHTAAWDSCAVLLGERLLRFHFSYIQ